VAAQDQAAVASRQRALRFDALLSEQRGLKGRIAVLEHDVRDLSHVLLALTKCKQKLVKATGYRVEEIEYDHESLHEGFAMPGDPYALPARETKLDVPDDGGTLGPIVASLDKAIRHYEPRRSELEKQLAAKRKRQTEVDAAIKSYTG
jgi:hypothetical protein